MADEGVRKKIRALLARAAPGSGATEDEAASAMNLASMLMTRHGIEMSMEEAQEDPTGYGEFIPGVYVKWHLFVAEAVGFLYYCRPCWQSNGKYKVVRFVGRPDNVDAASFTFTWLTDQVEALYKQSLPRGLSKDVRAELRRTFKLACAARIRGRAWKLAQAMASNDALSLPATGSTALVVKTHQEKLMGEADNFMKDKGVRIVEHKRSKAGVGTQLGLMAGDTVELQKSLGVKRKALPAK